MPRQKLKQRADGRYRCKYNGICFYGYTQQEALEARDEYKRQEIVGTPHTYATTVSAFALKWLPVAKASVSDKCYNDYAKQLNVLLEKIGDMPLQDVKPSDIRTVWPHYIGYSASTIHRAKMLYIALFEAAIADGYINRNPVKDKTAAPHKGTSGTHRAITDEERALIETTEHRFRAGAMAMLYAGLRRGEVFALDADKDIDRKRKTVSISKAIRFDGNKPVVAAPKTEAGERSIPLLKPLETTLNGVHGLVMPTVTGGLMTSTAFKRGWDSYMLALSKAAGHPVSIRPHDLRHTYCTMLRDSGVDIKQAMEWLGHADEKMILRIYDHPGNYRAQTSVEKLENYLKK